MSPALSDNNTETCIHCCESYTTFTMLYKVFLPTLEVHENPGWRQAVQTIFSVKTTKIFHVLLSIPLCLPKENNFLKNYYTF